MGPQIRQLFRAWLEWRLATMRLRVIVAGVSYERRREVAAADRPTPATEAPPAGNLTVWGAV